MRVSSGHLLFGFLGATALACGSLKASSDAGFPGDAGLRDATPYDARIIPIDSGHIPLGHVDVLTQHNDMSRTGQNLNETVLTTSNVNVTTFGKLATIPVDGFIYAQPLIVTNTQVGGAAHDVLIVATMNNSVYAFDANTFAPLWHVNLGPAVPSTEIGPIVPDSGGKHVGTLNILVQVGILSTPVIDRVNGYIYVTRKDFTGGVQSIKLHVLDLATGADEPGSPTTINAQVAGTGDDADDAGLIHLDPNYNAQRPGLLLFENTVYMAFASHEDYQPYHGWILGYTYTGGALKQTAVFNVTPDGHEGGIWNSGQGLISDGTSIYALVSNGSVTAPMGGQSYGEAFLRLNTNLEVQDYFIPVNYGRLNESDIDLGAGGPVLLPGTSPLLIAGGGKQGIMYVVDTTSMGKLGTVDDLNTQEWQAVPVNHSIYGSPVVWTGAADHEPRLYLWGTGVPLQAWELENGLFTEKPFATSTTNVTPTVVGQDPVGNLAVTSNGSTRGTGIVWACKPLATPDHATVVGTFYAFDATTLDELWDSNQNATRDVSGNYAKFVPPTVANGKVYLATHSGNLLVYGLLNDMVRDQ